MFDCLGVGRLSFGVHGIATAWDLDALLADTPTCINRRSLRLVGAICNRFPAVGVVASLHSRGESACDITHRLQ